MTLGWVLLSVTVLAAFAVRVAYLKFKPWRPCRGCRGKGYCVRCGYTGKVLRFGAGLVHPELKR